MIDAVYLPIAPDETGRMGFIRKPVADLSPAEQLFLTETKNLDARDPSHRAQFRAAAFRLFNLPLE